MPYNRWSGTPVKIGAKLLLIQTLILNIMLLSSEPTHSAELTSAQNDQVLISLPLKFHLVRSQIDLINATSDADATKQLLQRINEVWLAAGIQWSMQPTIVYPLEFEERIVRAMNGEAHISKAFLLKTLMSSDKSPKVWDIFIVHDLTRLVGAPGMYFPARLGMIVSESDPAGLNDPGRIIAHELGHSLGLKHVQCTNRGNLMSPGCKSLIRIRLEPEQILTTREQALTGRPFDGSF